MKKFLSFLLTASLLFSPQSFPEIQGSNIQGASIQASSETSSFSPDEFSGLIAWYDLNDPSTLFESTDDTDPAELGDTIGFFKDKSSNANHFTQATASNRPVYTDSVINDKPGLFFDGIADSMVDSSASGVDGLSGFTLYIVANRAFSSSNRGLYEIGSASIRVISVPGNGNYTCGVTTSAFVSGARSFGTIDLFYVRKCTYDGANIRWYFQGTNDTDPQTGTTASASDIDLGIASGFARWHGYVLEIILYNRALTDAEQNTVESYLSAKWRAA